MERKSPRKWLKWLRVSKKDGKFSRNPTTFEDRIAATYLETYKGMLIPRHSVDSCMTISSNGSDFTSNGSDFTQPETIIEGMPLECFPDNGFDFDDDDEADISDILSDKEINQLIMHLPRRLVCCSIRREFTTKSDGFSLSSVYRSLRSYGRRPALLIIRDMNGHRFGAFVSEAFRVSEFSFGCGETFVFSLQPDLRVWKWTGKNSFFVLCSNHSLCVGIDNGKFAICLDETLDKGRSQTCATFDNEPLTPTGDFSAAELEVLVFD